MYRNRLGLEYEFQSSENGTYIKLTKYGPKEIKVQFPKDLLDNSWREWVGGKNIRDAFPYLSPDEREFLMTGITPEEWQDTFGGEEREDE